MTAQELAKATGKCVGTVYYHARKLDRLPTVEELNAVKRGRKRKYK